MKSVIQVDLVIQCGNYERNNKYKSLNQIYRSIWLWFYPSRSIREHIKHEEFCSFKIIKCYWLWYILNKIFWGQKKKKERKERSMAYGREIIMELSFLKFTDYPKWASCRDDKPLACFRHKMKLVKFNHFILIDIFSVPSRNPGVEDLPVSRQKMPCLVEPRF